MQQSQDLGQDEGPGDSADKGRTDRSARQQRHPALIEKAI